MQICWSYGCDLRLQTIGEVPPGIAVLTLSKSVYSSFSGMCNKGGPGVEKKVSTIKSH